MKCAGFVRKCKEENAGIIPSKGDNFQPKRLELRSNGGERQAIFDANRVSYQHFKVKQMFNDFVTVEGTKLVPEGGFEPPTKGL